MTNTGDPSRVLHAQSPIAGQIEAQSQPQLIETAATGATEGRVGCAVGRVKAMLLVQNEVIEMVDRTARLRAENRYLRAALEAAPRPLPADIVFAAEQPSGLRWLNDYASWWLKHFDIRGKVRQRPAALGEGE